MRTLFVLALTGIALSAAAEDEIPFSRIPHAPQSAKPDTAMESRVVDDIRSTSTYFLRGAEITFEETPGPPAGDAAIELVPGLAANGKVLLRIRYQRGSRAYPQVLTELQTRLAFLTPKFDLPRGGRRNFPGELSVRIWAEIYRDAQAGSKAGRLALLHLEEEAVRYLEVRFAEARHHL